MKQVILLLLSTFVLGSGCIRKDASSENRYNANDSGAKTVQFAQGFKLRSQHDSLILTIRNPWQHATGIEFTYILGDSFESEMINEYTWKVKTPVNRVICLSTTHIGYIDFLNRTKSVYGISGREYVVNEAIRKDMAKNSISDVGYDEGLNYELILKLKPDVVFAYGVNVAITNIVKKLNELGIPVILIGEYLEHDPLAKMEWVKVFAAFYGIDDLAAAKFDSAVSRYRNLQALASTDQAKPAILLGLPWRGNWYVSGSQSYIARLVKDAGGRYIWEDLNYNESRPMGLEKIYEKALRADFWINPGEARSRREIISVDERFGSLPSIVNNKVYNNDNLLTTEGGNDFYESGVVEPDIILSDLIYILHPQLLPSYKLKYYRKLE
jgi:iron complex transport system substrate-binding protein